MIIRVAELSDLQQMLAIYNYEVINGVATLDISPCTYEQRKIWFDEHNIGNHPLIVAEISGHVAGYACLSSYRSKQAYNSTAELSVYVSPDFRGMGVATKLMKQIIDIAISDDSLHTIVSVITSDNNASIRLHEKFGFECCGTIKNAAYKFNRFIDIVNYRLSV